MEFATTKSFSLTDDDIIVKINSTPAPFTKKSKNTFTLLFPVSKQDLMEVIWTKHVDSSVSAFIPSAQTYEIDAQSGSGIITIAVEDSGDGILKDEILFNVVILDKQNTNLKKYVYIRPSGTSTIFGIDDSSNRSSMYFNESMTVSVMIDGVERDQKDYELVGNNIIKFIKPLKNEKNYIEVIVYPNSAKLQKEIPFRKWDYNTESAWSNVKEIGINGKTYAIFQSAELVNIDVNTPYVITSKFTGAYILFAKKPFTTFDRIYNVLYEIKTSVTEDYFVNAVTANSKQYKINLYTNGVIDLYTPVVIKSKFSADTVNADASYSPEETPNLGKTIIGPVV